MTWPIVKLGDVCEISRGGSPRPIQNYITEDVDGLNWIKIGDVNEGEKYITKTAEKIKPSGLSHTRQIKAGDFLLSNSMSFGRPYISKIDGCIHDGWLMLRDVKNNFSQDYLYHMLTSVTVKDQFIKYATGAVVKNLNKEVVGKVMVPLPSLDEQKRIAAILDRANEVRRKREESIEKLDALIRSVFLDISKSCKTAVNYSIKEIVKKYTPKPGNVTNVWSLTLEHIEGGSGKILNTIKIAKDKLGTSTYYFEHPVILYSKLRPYLNKVAIPKADGYATSELVPLYCDETKVLPSYLATYLRSDKFVTFANTNSGGAKMPRVMMDKFWAHKIPLPPISEQNKFEAIYLKCKNLQDQYQIELQSIDKLLLSLQHQAFTTGFNA